ncbi:hypothetical protein K504DRAFT_136540 [Pleomassaria siparia CBS 279.74]|uniref:Ribonuclease H1 N-terminal domain-containing protein n=1 Tax=Pleomassaria siparia CBS 279.74 TaxID=1314801 RepID=A0A6G1KM03_9PLEO|nr:hypothetical protein K504DRAFT_136540 [Pleomassaria siparia CBS 279.74]
MHSIIHWPIHFRPIHIVPTNYTLPAVYQYLPRYSMSAYRKRPREESGHLAHSTKRQRSAGQCSQEGPHTCPRSAVGKVKYYAIWGGPNPGIHHTTWATAQPWAQGTGSVKQKSFTDPSQALKWYADMKTGYPELARSSAHAPVHDPTSQLSPPPSPLRKPDEDRHIQISPNTRDEVASYSADCQHVKEEPKPDSSFPYVVPQSDPFLSREQSDLVHLILQGHNVFYKSPSSREQDCQSCRTHCPRSSRHQRQYDLALRRLDTSKQ